MAKFSISYVYEGREINVESENFTTGVNQTLEIPENATSIYLNVEEYCLTGNTTTIFTRTYPSPITKCFELWGTTLEPKWGEINRNSYMKSDLITSSEITEKQNEK